MVDVTDPALPVILDSFDTPAFAHNVEVAGAHVYVADETSGLYVIDASDPTFLFLADTYSSADETLDVDIVGDRAYLADRAAGLRILDISNPSNLPVRGRVRHCGQRPASLRRGRARVRGRTEETGISVIDVSDPSQPAQHLTFDTAGSARSLFLRREHAYVADGTGGLAVIEIAHELVPVRSGARACWEVVTRSPSQGTRPTRPSGTRAST